MDTINTKASKFLGKQLNDYNLQYSPDILVPIERSINREAYSITNDTFSGGYDIWHNYECSFLLDNGYPLTLVGKIKVPSDSKYFIESKSLKLYFFSFHLKRLGANASDAIRNFIQIVSNDLSEKTESQVTFNVFNRITQDFDFGMYVDLEDSVDFEKGNFANFKESPDLLELGSTGEFKVVFKNFRSNCRVTHQPDFSNIFISIKGNLPTKRSLLEYLVSFRNEYHFHEEVTEQIFKALIDKINPQSLVISNLFTRRGGLDICPVRYLNGGEDLPLALLNTWELSSPTIYQ